MTSRRTLGPLHVTRDRGEPTRLLGAIFAADLAWVDDRALCRQVDPALFFVEPGQDRAAALAKAICRECPLIEPCARYALAHAESGGIWGATSESDRKALRRKGRAA